MAKKRAKKEKLKSPLPMRDGVSASRVWLPNDVSHEWKTVLDFLVTRFIYLDRETIQERMAMGFIVDDAGIALNENTPYLNECFLFYYREVPDEVEIPFKEKILFKDDHIIVVDKPHFIPITPTGRYVKESLLVRLKNHFQIEEISPIHRLDRETAGVVMFTCNRDVRGAYQNLFQERQVDKTYEAIAPVSDHTFPLTHKSRIIKSDPFFIMQEDKTATEDMFNSETVIYVDEIKETLAKYTLKPITGRQHQLRIHMLSLGIPILNDAFYPKILARDNDDYTQPLQLLAKTICFTDPLSQEKRTFQSEQSLKL